MRQRAPPKAKTIKTAGATSARCADQAGRVSGGFGLISLVGRVRPQAVTRRMGCYGGKSGYVALTRPTTGLPLQTGAAAGQPRGEKQDGGVKSHRQKR